jgi:antiviral helicase SKI2
LSLFPDFQQRLSVLRELGYVEADSDTVTMKGRVACEINTCDEILATEIIFNNILEPLNPPETVAILSALVCQEKPNDTQPLTSRMEIAKEQIGDIKAILEGLQEKLGVRVDISDSKPSVNFTLAAAVYEWARGVSFNKIADLVNVQEGKIVRCITRLDELCKDVRNAARVIGNPSLYRKLEAASECIKRDIVFAASMYIA